MFGEHFNDGAIDFVLFEWSVSEFASVENATEEVVRFVGAPATNFVDERGCEGIGWKFLIFFEDAFEGGLDDIIGDEAVLAEDFREGIVTIFAESEGIFRTGIAGKVRGFVGCLEGGGGGHERSDIGHGIFKREIDRHLSDKVAVGRFFGG